MKKQFVWGFHLSQKKNVQTKGNLFMKILLNFFFQSHVGLGGKKFDIFNYKEL